MSTDVDAPARDTTPSLPSLGRIGQHTLVYGLGVLMNRAVGFLMLPVYTRFLTPSDYGVLQLITMVLEVVSIFAGSRLGAGIFYFFHKAEGEVARRRVLSTAAAVILVSYWSTAALVLLLAPQISNLVFGTQARTGLLRIAAGGLAGESLMLVPFAYLQVRERAIPFVVANAIKLLLQVSLNVTLLVGMHLGVKAILLSTLLSNGAVGLAATAYLLREVGVGISWETLNALLRFGLPFVATQVATFVATFGDRYFLNKASDPAVVGLYGLAYQFGFLLFSVTYTPFSSIWEPARFAIAKRHDRDRVYSDAFIYFNVFLLTVAVGLALFASDLLKVMATAAYQGAASLVPVILIAYVLQAWTAFHNIGIQVRERTEYITLANWVGAAVAVIGYLLLIPRWLGLGAALATVASFAAREVLVYWYSQRLWPVKYAWAPVIRLTVAAAAVTLIGLIPVGGGPIRALTWHSLLFLGYLAALWAPGILPEAGRSFVRRLAESPLTTLPTLLAGL